LIKKSLYLRNGARLEHRLLWNANRNSYAFYRMAIFPLTFSDPYLPQTTQFLLQVGTVRKRLNRLSCFWHRASFGLSYIVLEWNSVISKNKGTSLYNFYPNSVL